MSTDTRAEVARLALILERALGNPFEPDHPGSFERILHLDENEQYPHELLDVLQSVQMHEYAIPREWGGKAVNIETSLHLVRQVARRDPTVATALSISSLSYMPIWVAGTEEQRIHWGKRVREGSKISWGLTEREHGSDLLANVMSGEQIEGGYRIKGSKWLIGNATLAEAIVVFVRTGHRGPASYSLMIMDKGIAPPPAVQHLPRERLHGLRGIDMSGVSLEDAFVPSANVIGPPGTGLETSIKSSHAVRCLIVGIALGCADTALRLTLDFARNRVILGRPVVDIGYSRRQLVNAYLDLIAADCVATTSARSLQCVPAESSVHSAVSKFWVPRILGRTLTEVAGVLGARHYLRDDKRFGIFQKLLRDAPVAAFADGNEVVNIRALASQLPALVEITEAPLDAEVVHSLFDCTRSMPTFEPWLHDLVSRGGRNLVIDALPFTIERLAARGADELLQACGLVRDSLATLRSSVHELMEGYPEGYADRPEWMEIGERYCDLHVASAVLGIWAFGEVRLPDSVAALTVRRVLRHCGVYVDSLVGDESVVAEEMFRQHCEHLTFSLRELPIAWNDATHADI